MRRLLRRLLAIVAFVGVFAWLLTGAVDQELASGGVLTERGKGLTAASAVSTRGPDPSLMPRSVSACGASSIGPDGRVTVTGCGERLSERDHRGDGKRSAGVTYSGPARRGFANTSYIPVAKTSARSESLYQGRPIRWWARRAVQARKDANARGLTIRRLKREVALLERLNLDPLLAIRVVFGPWSAQAIRVSSCETGRTFDTGARNGQYLGLFQMGSYARSRYGHSSTALGQARAAFSYFVASGRDWSPWECKP